MNSLERFQLLRLADTHLDRMENTIRDLRERAERAENLGLTDEAREYHDLAELAIHEYLELNRSAKILSSKLSTQARLN